MRRFAPFLAVLLLTAGVALIGEGAARSLRYERAALLDGELWRLLSGHLVHLSWGHLLLNLAALALLAPFAPAWVLLPSGMGVSLGLLLFSPAVTWYVGLSGALHGLFSCAALAASLAGKWGGSGGLALLALKLAYEALWGPLPGSADMAGGPIVLPAHLYGAIAGLPFASLLRRKSL